MVEISEIVDETSLRGWLEDRTRQEVVWIASRAAARVLPPLWLWLIEKNSRVQQISLLRTLLRVWLPAVAARHKIRHFDHKAEHALFRTQGVLGGANATAVSASSTIFEAGRSAFCENNQDARNYTTDAIMLSKMGLGSASKTYFWGDTFWAMQREDCRKVLDASFSGEVSLWNGFPSPFARDWESLKSVILTRSLTEQANWSFWINCYEALLTGENLNWPLLEQVALIEPEIWEDKDDPLGAVAREIAEIEKRFLLAEVRRLKEEARVALSNPDAKSMRGHNNPPELVEDAAMGLAQSITVIWETLSEAEEELQKEEPDPNRLKALSDWLTTVLKKAGAYCASLADISLKKGAEVIGETGTKWAIRGSVAYFSVQTEPVQTLATWLGRYAEMLVR